jgi:hypothetical protein
LAFSFCAFIAALTHPEGQIDKKSHFFTAPTLFFHAVRPVMRNFGCLFDE